MAKTKTTESDLLKALSELEDAANSLAKGDRLAQQDTEGGLSTQGTKLSGKAPTGRKADLSKMLSASDDVSADAGSEEDEPPKTKKVKKALPPPKDKEDESEDESAGGDESADDDSSDNESDDEGGDDESMGKSLREDAEGNETLSKAMEVSEFLEALVDTTSESLSRSTKHLAKSLGTKITDSFAAQGEFNTRLARGVVGLGKMVKSLAEQNARLVEIIEGWGGQASIAPRGRAVLNKSELAPAPNGGESGESDDSGDAAPRRVDIENWLIEKAQHDPNMAIYVAQFDNAGGNPNVLPQALRKSMMHDLKKAS